MNSQFNLNVPTSSSGQLSLTGANGGFGILLCLQYVVETRFVGEKEQGVAGAEIVGVKERIVDQAAPGPACLANAGMCCCCCRLPGSAFSFPSLYLPWKDLTNQLTLSSRHYIMSGYGTESKTSL